MEAVGGCESNDRASGSTARHRGEALIVVRALLHAVSLDHKADLELLKDVGGVVALDLVVKVTAENALSLWQGGALDLAKAITVPQPCHLGLLCAEPKWLQARVAHGCVAVLRVWFQTINVCQRVPVSPGVAKRCPDAVQLIVREGA
eukprot:2866777-Rhodomonas_salina.1